MKFWERQTERSTKNHIRRLKLTLLNPASEDSIKYPDLARDVNNKKYTALIAKCKGDMDKRLEIVERRAAKHRKKK